MNELLRQILQMISDSLIPAFIALVPLIALRKRVQVYDEFIEGAKGGFDVALRIIPYLVAILVPRAL